MEWDRKDAKKEEIRYTLVMDEQARANALMEDMDAKFQVILEAVKPIPHIQQDIKELKNQGERMQDDIVVLKASVQINSQGISQLDEKVSELGEKVSELDEKVSELKETVDEMKPVLDATFEEVGSLRVDMETSKEDIRSHIQKHR